MTPMVKNFAKCGCGRTRDLEGYCDSSHALSEEEYAALQDLEEIDWGDEECNGLNERYYNGCRKRKWNS